MSVQYAGRISPNRSADREFPEPPDHGGAEQNRSTGRQKRVALAARSRYSTAQKTSFKSTLRGAVFLRELSNSGLMVSNCSRLMSLG